jgi:hypothetical protein
MPVALLKGADHWTPQRRLAAGVAPGRRPGRLPGGHVADRADLRKAITLCDSCLPKFNAASAEYVTKDNLPFVQGACDGCQRFTPRGHLLVHRSVANLA